VFAKGNVALAEKFVAFDKRHVALAEIFIALAKHNVELAAIFIALAQHNVALAEKLVAFVKCNVALAEKLVAFVKCNVALAAKLVAFCHGFLHPFLDAIDCTQGVIHPAKRRSVYGSGGLPARRNNQLVKIGRTQTPPQFQKSWDAWKAWAKLEEVL
jgi:hypothetical protein